MRRRGAVGSFELGEHQARPLDHGHRQARELGHLNPVGAVGDALGHLVQENHVALEFLDPHGGVHQPLQPRDQRGQLMEMGGEQRAAAVVFVQMLERRPGDR